MKTRIGIVGFRGYSGMEAVRILSRHPHAQPYLMEHRQDAAERPHPMGHSGPPRIECTAEAAVKSRLAAVLLATPAEVSMELAPSLLEAGMKVIDLSGAFRLRTPENYKRWYKAEHSAPQLLEEAIYGLPEFYRDRICQARLVANPGCYPTAANLALRPLVAAGILEPGSAIICDAKSGVSGAGRKPSLKTSFCEVTENFSAYSVLDHRHVPEVLLNSDVQEADFYFTAHLLPVDRGILETFYLRVRDGVVEQTLLDAYREFYQQSPFIRIYPPGIMPDLRCVQHTNYCDIGVKVDGATRRAVVVSAIDNLVKGAAGQAVQNLNLIMGWSEAEGLE